MPSQLKIYTFTTSYHENITWEHPDFQTEGWLKRYQEAQDKWLREKLIITHINGNFIIDDFIHRIVNLRNYPRYDNEGENIVYQLARLQSDPSSLQSPLPGRATLDKEGIQNEEKLVLYPGLNAGGPDPLTIAAGVAAITQVVLMVIDMWSRRKKEHEVNNTDEEIIKVENKDEFLAEIIKEIRMGMSDGNWVKFNGHFLNPNRLRSFIELFNSPSASPKLVKVVLIFKNGSKVFINISDESGNDQLIEKLLAFIRESSKQ